MDDGGKCLLDVINDPLLFQSFFEGREDADADGLSANMLDQHLESLAHSGASSTATGHNPLLVGSTGAGVLIGGLGSANSAGAPASSSLPGEISAAAALTSVSLANGSLACPSSSSAQQTVLSASPSDGKADNANASSVRNAQRTSTNVQQLAGAGGSGGHGFVRMDDFGLTAQTDAQIPSQINLDQINLRLDSSAPGLEALQQQLLSSPAYQAGLSKAFSRIHPATTSSHSPNQLLSNGQLSADLEGCLNGTSDSPPASNSSNSSTTATTTAAAAAANVHSSNSSSNNSSSCTSSSNQISNQPNASTGCGAAIDVASPQAGTAPRATLPHHQPPPPTAYSPAGGPVASPVLQAGALGGASPAPPPSPAALATSQRSTPTLSVASPLMSGCMSGPAGAQVGQIIVPGGSTGPGSVPPRTLTPSQSPRLLNGGATTPNGLGVHAGGSNTPASNPATPVPSVSSDVITPSPSPHLQQMAQHAVTFSTSATGTTASISQQVQQQLFQQVVAVSSSATATHTSSISVAPSGGQGAQTQIILGPHTGQATAAGILQAAGPGGPGTILLNQAMLHQQLQAAATGQTLAAAAAAAAAGGSAGGASHHHHHHHHHGQPTQHQPLFVQSVNGQLQLIHRSPTMLQPGQITQVGGTGHPGGGGPGAKAIMLGHPGQSRPNFVLAPKLNPGGGLSFQLQPASPQQTQPLLIQPQQLTQSQMSAIHLAAGGAPTFVQMAPSASTGQTAQIIAAATPPLATTPSPAPVSQTPSPAPSNSSKPSTPSGKEAAKANKSAANSSASVASSSSTNSNSQTQQNKARPSVNLGDLLKEHGILDASPPPSPSPQPTQQQPDPPVEAMSTPVLEPPKKSALLERLTSAPPPTPPATTQKVGMLQINGNMVPVVLPPQMAGQLQAAAAAAVGGQLQSLQVAQHHNAGVGNQLGQMAAGGNVITVQTSPFRQHAMSQQQQQQQQNAAQMANANANVHSMGAGAAGQQHSQQTQHRGQTQQQQLQVAVSTAGGMIPTHAVVSMSVAAPTHTTTLSAANITINNSNVNHNQTASSSHSSASSNKNNNNNHNSSSNISAMQQQQTTVIQSGAPGQPPRMVYLSGNAAIGDGGKVVSLVGGQFQQVGSLGAGGQVVIRQGVPPRPPQNSPINDPLYERLKTQLAGLSALENPTAQQRVLLQQMVALHEQMKQQVQQQQQQQQQQSAAQQVITAQQQMVTQQHSQQVLVTTAGGGQVVLGGGPVGQPQIITIQPQQLQQLQNAAAAAAQSQQRPQQHLRTIAPAPSSLQIAMAGGLKPAAGQANLSSVTTSTPLTTGNTTKCPSVAGGTTAGPTTIDGSQILRLASGQTALLNGAHALSSVGGIGPGVVVVQAPAAHQQVSAAAQTAGVQVTTVSVAQPTSHTPTSVATAAAGGPTASPFVNTLTGGAAQTGALASVAAADNNSKLQQQGGLLLGGLGGVSGLAGLQANAQLVKKLVLGNVNGIPTVVQLNTSQLSQLGQFGQLATGQASGIIQLLQQQQQQQQQQANAGATTVQTQMGSPHLVVSSASQVHSSLLSAVTSTSTVSLSTSHGSASSVTQAPVVKSVSSLLNKLSSTSQQTNSVNMTSLSSSGQTSIITSLSNAASGQLALPATTLSNSTAVATTSTKQQQQQQQQLLTTAGHSIQVKLQPAHAMQAVVKTEVCDSTVVTPPSASPLPTNASLPQTAVVNQLGTPVGIAATGGGAGGGLVSNANSLMVSSASTPATCPTTASPLLNGPPLAAEAPNTSSPPHQLPHGHHVQPQQQQQQQQSNIQTITSTNSILSGSYCPQQANATAQLVGCGTVSSNSAPTSSTGQQQQQQQQPQMIIQQNNALPKSYATSTTTPPSTASSIAASVSQTTASSPLISSPSSVTLSGNLPAGATSQTTAGTQGTAPSSGMNEYPRAVMANRHTLKVQVPINVSVPHIITNTHCSNNNNNTFSNSTVHPGLAGSPTVKMTPPKKKKKKKTKKEREMEQAERERAAKEKMALTAVKTEASSPPSPVGSLSSTLTLAPTPLPPTITTTLPSTPVTAKVLIKQDISISPQADGDLELITPPALPAGVVSLPASVNPQAAPPPNATVILQKHNPTPVVIPVGPPPAVGSCAVPPIVSAQATTPSTTAKTKIEVKDLAKTEKDGQPKPASIVVVEPKDVKEQVAKDVGVGGKDAKHDNHAKDVGAAKTTAASNVKVITPIMTKAAKKRQAAKERERLAQEKFKRQRFEQRVLNDQKEVLTPRLEPFKERQEAIKRLLSYHVADVAEPSVLALQECDAAFERLSARMLQAKEHLISRFQLTSLKSGMSDTPVHESLLVSRLLLDDEKQLQSERVEETLSLMEEPDPSGFFSMPTSPYHQHGDHLPTYQPTTVAASTNETGFSAGGCGSSRSHPMDAAATSGGHASSEASSGRADGENRSEMLLPDDLDVDHDPDQDPGTDSCGGTDAELPMNVDSGHEALGDDEPLLGRSLSSRRCVDFADEESEMDGAGLGSMHDEQGHPNSLDLDEAASCHSATGALGDADGCYPRLASLSVPSVPSVHSGHSQPALGEDSLSELVTDGQLLSNQLLAQSDDPDLDNAVNSILFA